MLNEYEKMAKDFCTKNHVKIWFSFIGMKQWRAIGAVTNTYRVSIVTPIKGFTVTFHDSINNTVTGARPTKYDILACLTKYNPGSFKDFCNDFGYDEYNRNSMSTYRAVLKEWERWKRPLQKNSLKNLEKFGKEESKNEKDCC